MIPNVSAHPRTPISEGQASWRGMLSRPSSIHGLATRITQNSLSRVLTGNLKTLGPKSLLPTFHVFGIWRHEMNFTARTYSSVAHTELTHSRSMLCAHCSRSRHHVRLGLLLCEPVVFLPTYCNGDFTNVRYIEYLEYMRKTHVTSLFVLFAVTRIT